MMWSWRGGDAKRLAADLEQASAETARERSANRDLSDKLSRADVELAQVRATGSALGDQLSAVGAELAHARSTINALNDQLKATGAELQQERKTAEHFKSLRDQARSDNAVISRSFEQVAQAVARLDPGSSDIAEQIEALRASPNLALASDLSGLRGRPAAAADSGPAMLIASLPKAASVSVVASLAEMLRKPIIGGVAGGVFPDFTLAQEGFIDLQRRRALCHVHLGPSRTNLIELGVRFKLDRMVVHIRDPRQALLSWIHFVPSVITQLDPSQALHYGMPEDYLAWSFERQVDWQIEAGWLPRMIQWIDGWVGAVDNDWFRTEILFTRFEDFVADPDAFFGRILAFYGVERPDLAGGAAKPPTLKRNFRRGDADEWRRSFSAEQQGRINAAMPARLFNRFGWAR